MDRVARGDDVVGPSMARLGRVAETAEDRFLLEVRDGRRLWMNADSIFTVDSGVVTLICEYDHLAQYTLPAPGGRRSA